MDIKNLKVLITGGPTWVAIDPVRVITNTASGETGHLLSSLFAEHGASVTFLLGPGGYQAAKGRYKIIRYRYFEELQELLEKQLRLKYDVVIHAAAVSDYKPEKASLKKLKSDRTKRLITLVKTPKLIDRIRMRLPHAVVIGFKYEPDVHKNVMIARGTTLLKHTKIDGVVANSLVQKRYQAFLVTPESVSGAVMSKKILAQKIVKFIIGV
jgi:phosphopantothenoylcysteine decarboxylase / phosphopantothenate---cysteine ligase